MNINVIDQLCYEAYTTSRISGFHNPTGSVGERIALMHSELSEALEAHRKPEKKDEHLPDEDPVGLELADVCIRIFDFCGAENIKLGELILKKMDYNKSRPYKHGKNF